MGKKINQPVISEYLESGELVFNSLSSIFACLYDDIYLAYSCPKHRNDSIKQPVISQYLESGALCSEFVFSSLSSIFEREERICNCGHAEGAHSMNVSSGEHFFSGVCAYCWADYWEGILCTDRNDYRDPFTGEPEELCGDCGHLRKSHKKTEVDGVKVCTEYWEEH